MCSTFLMCKAYCNDGLSWLQIFRRLELSDRFEWTKIAVNKNNCQIYTMKFVWRVGRFIFYPSQTCQNVKNLAFWLNSVFKLFGIWLVMIVRFNDCLSMINTLKCVCSNWLTCCFTTMVLSLWSINWTKIVQKTSWCHRWWSNVYWNKFRSNKCQITAVNIVVHLKCWCYNIFALVTMKSNGVIVTVLVAVIRNYQCTPIFF